VRGRDSVSALYGYESVRLVLDAIRAAGASRAGVVRAALAAGPRRSVIGTYRVLRTGDVSERGLGLERYAGGHLIANTLIG
jgi:hypothetical protein